MSEQQPRHHTRTFENLDTEKQLRVLRAAEEVFATDGYESAKITNIARIADVSVGALYKYFENKQNIYLSVIHHSIAQMEELLTTLSQTDEDILLKAEKIIREIQRFSRQDRLLIKLYQGATAQNDPALSVAMATEIETAMARVYVQAIELAQESGDIRADIDPHFAAFLLNSFFMMLQFSYSCDYHIARFQIYTDGKMMQDDYVRTQTLQFLKAALK
ncbi:MAG: TetR/AcrR family transcriptional regulator [Oscillospiraceae bacterium]|nr:TetR/AcrR family transcriptional regulator [Oscillospiraceae bacterium]